VLVFGFQARNAVSLFNNSEEAKRIDAQLRGVDVGCDCIYKLSAT
jgi:hypothetical protein